jgi:hypothetical protein
MADPASGTVAATTAITTTTTSIFALGQFMPPGASMQEFVWGILFAMFGAFCYQFIAGQVARQIATDAHVPIAQLPRVDRVMVAYAVLGAPLSAAFLIFGIHYFHGATGFGDTTFFQSVAGFMAAGAAGPKIVIKAVAAIVALISSRIGGKTP